MSLGVVSLLAHIEKCYFTASQEIGANIRRRSSGRDPRRDFVVNGQRYHPKPLPPYDARRGGERNADRLLMGCKGSSRNTMTVQRWRSYGSLVSIFGFR